MVKEMLNLDYVQKITHSRTGRIYYYYRRFGKRVPIKSPFGTPEFLAEINEITEGLRDRETPPPGTLGHLIQCYKMPTNDAWTSLRPATRLSYQRAFDALADFSMRKVAGFTRPAILRIRDEIVRPARGRWMANYVVTVLGVLFAFEHDRNAGFVSPLKEKVRKIRKPRRLPGEPVKNRPWTDEERAAVLKEAPQHIKLPIALGMCTGWRKADLFKSTMNAFKGDEIAIYTSKTDYPVRVPLHPVLKEALQGRPKSDAVQIVLNQRGQPYTPDGFDTMWHKFRERLLKEGKIGPGLTLHGLRHSLGKLLKEAGVPDEDAQKIMGHDSAAMTKHYNKAAELPKSVKAAVIKLDIAGKKKAK